MDKLLTYLYSLERRGVKVGLEHTRQLLDVIGNPQSNFRSIHVAGTNGKGTTCAMIASILRAGGIRTGLYTSPHLIKFNERLRVNGQPISDTEIIKFVNRYKDSFDSIPVTFFEATTAMAFWYFEKKLVDIAVIETGLGGRLDSTNVLLPELSVITPIDLDHCHILGKTVQKIAKEKGGIIKPKTPVVIAPQNKETFQILEGISNRNDSPHYSVEKPKSIKCDWVDMNTKFKIKNEKYSIPLLGEHQATNAATAIKAIEVFDKNLSYQIIIKGLDKTVWPGRFQKLHGQKPIFYDVAHNSHGLIAVLKTVELLFTEKPLGLIALKEDKELDTISKVIKDRFSELIPVFSDNADLWHPSELSQKLKIYEINNNPSDNIYRNIFELKKKVKYNKPALIFGSHYIAEDIFKVFDFSFDSGII